MALIESELNTALGGFVKRKANRTEDLKATAGRITRAARSSEVMLKITGFGKGASHVQGHLSYISRKGELELENNLGDVFKGKEEVKEFFKEWEHDFGHEKRHKNQRDTMHMVLSMREGTDPESVKSAVRELSKKTFGINHEYVFALHIDEPHPHCHIAVKCLGFDGTRLNPRKADLQEWRESFAEELRAQGVDEAEATPRRSRGVVMKAVPAVLLHIERGDKTHPPRVPKVKAAKIKEMVQEITAEINGQAVLDKPWEKAIKARQTQIRSAWLNAADALEGQVSRITFDQKEAKNERPHYEQISIERARADQRAAALYQSRLEASGRQASPGHIASVRNLSSLAVVQHQRNSEMLLQSNAPDRVGRHGGADIDVRRTGTGTSGAPGAVRSLASQSSIAEDNKTLAARIRKFVAGMPSIDTERHQLKKELLEKFSLQPQKQQARQAEAAQKTGLPARPQAPRQDDQER